jgi:hypothetical protein
MNGISLGVLSSGALAGAERSGGERSEPQRSAAAAKVAADSVVNTATGQSGSAVHRSGRTHAGMMMQSQGFHQYLDDDPVGCRRDRSSCVRGNRLGHGCWQLC